MNLNQAICICGNELSFEACCGKFISKKEKPKSAVELMRSRYSAYVLKNGQYLYDTCAKHLQNTEDIEAINGHDIQWFGLKIESFSEKEVTFMAYYKENSIMAVMKEHSYFIIDDEGYKYDRGEILEAKISRNELCPCASGKKHKKCCG
jgi:SEC-C motif-containing protein